MNNKEMMKRTDEIISELVRDKVEFQKAYNYYAGERDEEQFKYLEENFGIGSPTSVKMTPMVKKHIDALIGEYLGTPILPKVSCKDSETISAITREKSLAIAQGVTKFLQDHLNTTLVQFIDGKDTGIEVELGSTDYWEQVVSKNANYEYAYVGIGHKYLNNGEYKTAMEYFELGKNKIYYSKAFKQYRDGIIKEWFAPVAITLAVIIVGYYVFKFVRNKKLGIKKVEETGVGDE